MSITTLGQVSNEIAPLIQKQFAEPLIVYLHLLANTSKIDISTVGVFIDIRKIAHFTGLSMLAVSKAIALLKNRNILAESSRVNVLLITNKNEISANETLQRDYAEKKRSWEAKTQLKDLAKTMTKKIT